MILHIVFYQPKVSATRAELAELLARIEAASKGIPSIKQVRVGRSTDLGFDYKQRVNNLEYDFVAIFEFNNVSGLIDYLNHPEHSSLAQSFWNTCDRTAIMDMSAVDPRHERLDEIVG